MITNHIVIGSDHAGFELKEHIIGYLKSINIKVDDKGTYSASASVDYPDYAKAVADEVTANKDRLGILICGSGIGISIAANKIKGIRAALACDAEAAKMSRMHNDANILVMAGRPFDPQRAKKAEEMVKSWLDTEFEGGRHQQRIDKIHDLE